MLVDPQAWALGLIGGLMIGSASAIMLLGLGRIAGISGIAGALLRVSSGSRGQDAAFVAGLILIPLVVASLIYRPELDMTTNPVVLVVAGAIVGIGTRMGSGCTSGHGVCGMTRFSRRSFVSVGVFMITAAVVASIVTPVFGV